MRYPLLKTQSESEVFTSESDPKNRIISPVKIFLATREPHPKNLKFSVLPLKFFQIYGYPLKNRVQPSQQNLMEEPGGQSYYIQTGGYANLITGKIFQIVPVLNPFFPYSKEVNQNRAG